MDYYDILINGITDELYVSRIVHGKSWIAAELSDGRYGIAMRHELESRSRLFDSLCVIHRSTWTSSAPGAASIKAAPTA